MFRDLVCAARTIARKVCAASFASTVTFFPSLHSYENWHERSVGHTEVISITGIFDHNLNVQERQKTKYSQRGIFECFEHLWRLVNTF